MANRDAASGFEFHSSPGPFPGRSRTYVKLVGTGTAIFIGDVVHFKAGTSLSEGKPVVEPLGTGTPGTTIIGGVALDYGAASTKTRHTVIVDENAEYHAQDDGDNTGIAATNIGQNANVVANAGSTTTFYSGHEIDGSTAAVTSTLDVYLVGILPRPDTAFGSDFVRTICRFNRNIAESGFGITRV